MCRSSNILFLLSLIAPATTLAQVDTKPKPAWMYKDEIARIESEKQKQIAESANNKEQNPQKEIPVLSRTEAEQKFPEIVRNGIPLTHNSNNKTELSIDEALDLLSLYSKKSKKPELEDDRAYVGTFSVSDLYKYALNDSRVKRLRESGYSIHVQLHYDLAVTYEDFYIIQSSGGKITRISESNFKNYTPPKDKVEIYKVTENFSELMPKAILKEPATQGLFRRQDSVKISSIQQLQKGESYSIRGIPKDRNDPFLTLDEEKFQTDSYAFHHEKTFKEKLSANVENPQSIQGAIEQSEAAMRKDSLVKVHVFGEFSESGTLMSPVIRIEIAANHGDLMNCATRILSRETREELLREMRAPSFEKTVQTLHSIPKYPDQITDEFNQVRKTLENIQILGAPVFTKEILDQYFSSAGKKPDMALWRQNVWKLNKRLKDVITWNAENALKLEATDPNAASQILQQLQDEQLRAFQIIEGQDLFVAELSKEHLAWQYKTATALVNLPEQLLTKELQNTFLPEETYHDRILVYYRAPSPIMETIDAHLMASLQEHAGLPVSSQQEEYFNRQLRSLSQVFSPYIEAGREDYFKRLFSEKGIDYSEKKSTGDAVTHSAYLKGQAILNYVSRHRGYETPVLDENGKAIPKYDETGVQIGWETVNQPGPMFYVRSALDLLNVNQTFIHEFEKLKKTSQEFGFQKVALTVCTRVGADRASKILLSRMNSKEQLYAVEQKLPLEVGISINNYIRRKNGTMDAVPRFVNKFVIDTLNPDSPDYIGKFSATKQIIEPTIDATRKVEVFLREKIENNKSIRSFQE